MKRILAFVVVAAAVAFTIGATADNQGQGQQTGQQNVYFGFLNGSVAPVPGSSTTVPRLAAVAVDLGAPDRSGQRRLRAYVCDGFGVGVAGAPEGLAVWFRGTIPASPVAGTFPLTVHAPARLERIVINAATDHAVHGTLIEANGATSQFVAYEAIDGAGIYQVTLDQ